MSYPKSLIGLVFILEYNWYKDSEEVDNKTDLLLQLPFVQSVEFGPGANPVFVIEVELPEQNKMTLQGYENQLKKIIGVKP